MLFSRSSAFNQSIFKQPDIFLPENLTMYAKNFEACPNGVLENSSKLVLAEFIKREVGSITLDPSVLFLLTEYLYREALKSKNDGAILEFKNHLSAGMILRYIRLTKNLNEFKSRSLLVNKLCFVISSRTTIDSILKCDQNKFYANPLAVASDNLQHIYNEWYGLYLNPELLDSHDRLSLLGMAQDQCHKFSELAEAIRHGKNKISVQERESLATFMFANPFKDCFQAVVDSTKTIKYIKQQYMHTILLLTAWYDPNANSAGYGKKLNSIMAEFISKDPVNIANLCVYLLTQNQTGKYTMMNSQRKFAGNILPFILSFLRMKSYHNEQHGLLREMRNSLSVESIKMFGNALTQELCAAECKPFTAKTLSHIYDLRLGLHDIKHLNNQAKLVSELFYAQYKGNHKLDGFDIIIPEVYSQHIISPSSFNYDLDSCAKRRLACIQFSGTNKEHSYDELREIIRFLKVVNKERFVADNYADQKYLPSPVRSLNMLSPVVKNLKQILNNVVSATEDKARLYIGGTLRLKINCISPLTVDECNSGFILGSLYCSFSYLGEGNWVMHEPNLPQGYIRFSHKMIFHVGRHIVESCSDLITEEHNKLGYSIKYINLCPLSIDNSQRVTVRRSLTPAPL